MLLRDAYTTDHVVIFKLASSGSLSGIGMVAQSSVWATKAHEIEALRNKVSIP